MVLASAPARLTAVTAGIALAATGFIGGAAAFADDDSEREDHSEQYEREDHDDDRDEGEDRDDDSDNTRTADRQTNCTGVADASLHVERSSAKRLAVEVDVDNVTPGEQWLLEVWHNGKQRLSSTRVAEADGEVDAYRTVKNRRGKDRIRLRATSENDQTCTAKVQGFKAAAKAPKNKAGKPPEDYTSRPS